MKNFSDFIDTTLRDGQKSPLLYDSRKYYFTVNEKKQILKALIELGVKHFEFFSPGSTSFEHRDFSKLKKYTDEITTKKIMFLASCKCTEEDVENCVKADFNGVNLHLGLFEMNNLLNEGDNEQDIEAIISNIRKKYPRLYIRFSVEDFFRISLSSVLKTYSKVYKYVDTLCIADSTGVATPKEVKASLKKLKNEFPRVNIEGHFHNDRGLAVENAISAVEAGCEYIDSSIWGLAERSGISSVTAILLNLFHKDEKISNDYNIELCYPMNVLMGSILDMQVPYNEPVSLTNRTHIAGFRNERARDMSKIYEANDLDKFGVTREELLFGPLTSWNFVYYYLKEVENYVITPEIAKDLTKIFRKRIKKFGRGSKPEQILDAIVGEYSLEKTNIPYEYEQRRVENL
jgi:homocitrate synthase